MKKLHRARDFLAGALVMALALCLIVPAGAALTGKKIDVLQGIEIFVDGVKLEPKDTNGKSVETFVYNGTTYVPLRAVSQSLGKAVSYDGKTQRVYIGKDPNKVQYLMEVCPPYYESSGMNIERLTGSESVTMAGKQYSNGLSFKSGGNEDYALFNLNGAYNTLTADLGHVDSAGGMSDGTVYFYVDDVLVASFVVKGADLPKTISVPLNGGLQLKISMKCTGSWYTELGLTNIVVE